ncbi:MAG: 16S rRNA (guanine(527)-N(7))-methyltransferase RsmG [Phycisphaerae bacterium]
MSRVRAGDGAFGTALRAGLAGLGVPITDDALEALTRHFILLIEANQHINLTRITDPTEAALRLYADSAAVPAWASQRGIAVKSVLDVGSGAGFPALPLAVLQPAWKVTAVEATGKKAAFIESTVRALGLPNVRAVHAHSEHWSCETRFDVITFKAVGALEGCLACAADRVLAGGHVAVYKTANLSTQETETGGRAARKYGLESVQGLTYSLPLPDGPGQFALHVFRRR